MVKFCFIVREREWKGVTVVKFCFSVGENGKG